MLFLKAGAFPVNIVTLLNASFLSQKHCFNTLRNIKQVCLANANATYSTRKRRRPSNAPPLPKSTKLEPQIKVLGLSSETTTDSLYKYFAETFSPPISCKVAEDRRTGDSYFYGSVNFSTHEEREKVLSSSPLTIDGETVHAKVYSKGLPPKALCVSGLPENITEEVLSHLYSNFGTVSSVQISRNAENKCRGFAFVLFSSLDELYKALYCRPHKLQGKELEVGLKGKFNPELTLFIEDLQANTKSVDLYHFYAKYDRLDHCLVKKEKETKESREFGYVTFATTQGFDDALNDQPHVISGKQVLLNYASKDFTIEVAGLSPKSTNQSVQQFFSQFGKVFHCSVKDTERGSRIAFVTFETLQEVETASKASPYVIDGTEVSALICHQEEYIPHFGVVIRGIADRIGEAMLIDYFSKYGLVMHCQILREKHSNAMGFVDFKSEEAMKKAVQRKKHSVDGYVMDVEISKINKLQSKREQRDQKYFFLGY